jgi:hypothetical protein
VGCGNRYQHSEVVAGLGDQFRLVHRTGVRVNPLDRSFHYTGYEGVNYMLLLQKDPGVTPCQITPSKRRHARQGW